MASYAAPESPASSPTFGNEENNLQPFYVLHKALRRKSERKETQSGKTRRKIDLIPASPKSPSKSNKDERAEEHYEHHYERLRITAFDRVWSEIETSIKDALRDMNTNVFNQIHQWVFESFAAIRVSDTISKQIFTGLVLTKNVEFVDDLLTFEELGKHLKSHGFQVANLSSLEFSAKNGIGGCLRNLLRQFVSITMDAPDMSVLASWYMEQEGRNLDIPLVVIVDDMDRCNGSVLGEFILMLSEWGIKIPIILIMGVTTSVDALRSLLSSNALQHLCPFKFILGSPAERMDGIIRSALLKPSSSFIIGNKVALFLRNYFLRQDGTITSFIRALKISCVKHFAIEPLSFILGEEDFLSERCALLPKPMIKYAFDLPSCKRDDEMCEQTGENLALGLSEMKRLRRNWCCVVLCLYEAGKHHNIQLLDLLCEALDPSCADYAGNGIPKGGSNLICQAIRKVRDLPVALLYQLLKMWEKHTEFIAAINDKVKELLSTLKFEVDDDGKSSKGDSTKPSSKRPTSRSHSNTRNERKTENEKAAILMECMVRDYLGPIECSTFHEVFCFKDLDMLKPALIGNPRRMIQLHLLKSPDYLKCSCCSSRSGSVLLSSMNDTAIMYTLAQEHGDLINLHDWYHSFRATVFCSSERGKHKMKKSLISKKQKHVVDKSQDMSEASIQAQFCRAVVDLQITGLLRMPSKRRPDYVHRVAFGL